MDQKLDSGHEVVGPLQDIEGDSCHFTAVRHPVAKHRPWVHTLTRKENSPGSRNQAPRAKDH